MSPLLVDLPSTLGVFKMRFLGLASTLSLILVSGCGPSQADYDSAQAEIQHLRAEVADLRNTPTQRLAHARDLLTRDSAMEAEREFAELANRFPGSSEASIARTAGDS